MRLFEKKKKRDKNGFIKRKSIIVSEENKNFYFVESFKSLRTNVRFIAQTENVNSFLITSAIQDECKSNVSVNLAITLAEEGKKVVLVDCDFRKPTVSRYLRIREGAPGIMKVLMNACSLEEAIYHDHDNQLDVLGVDLIPPNPSELLLSDKMHDLIITLKKEYDYVIIDTPPINLVTDAAVIGGMVDGAFLVVRSDYAPVEMVRNAKKKLEDVNIKIYGSILTRFEPKTKGRGSRYYKYYNNYYQ